MQERICRRCGHKWYPRAPRPVKCPRCQSARWNEAALDRAERAAPKV